VVEKSVIVLVLGKSSGIGKSICEKFLYEKAVVINADRQAPLKIVALILFFVTL
jgi:NAD(P)-dependent dehydrogenase (short-subunit alcohol dehydrogenase family)